MRYEVYGKGVRGERREARGERKEMRGGATPPPSCAHVRPSSEAHAQSPQRSPEGEALAGGEALA